MQKAVAFSVAAQVREHPLIWVVDGLCSDRRVRHLQQLVDQEDGLQKTATWAELFAFPMQKNEDRRDTEERDKQKHEEIMILLSGRADRCRSDIQCNQACERRSMCL